MASRRKRHWAAAKARAEPPLPRALILGASVAVGAVLAWVYAPVVFGMAGRWSTDAQYSHGYLVPLFAGVLVWLKRKKLAAAGLRPSWWGLPLLVLGAGLLVLGGRLDFDWFEEISLLPTVAGLCLLLAGERAFRYLWAAVVFLVFMIPLPFRAEKALAEPLQSIATTVSTYTLQTLGLPALQEGNVIVLNEGSIGVVEACSGLSMMMVFFALAFAVVILVRRPLLDKVVLVISAIPIAILANVTRIVVTGFLYENVGGEVAKAFFHDFAGWLMMPLALLLLWLELKLLSWLLIEVTPARPLTVGFKDASAVRGEKVLQPRT